MDNNGADDEKNIKVWDIGGQSIASEMIDKYIAGAQAALIVYDVTNMRSFDNVQDWLQVVKRVTKNEEKPPHTALVGNKTDLEQKRVVTVEAHNTLAKKHDMMPMYVSAKTGDSVLMLFRQTVADLLKIVLSKADQEADIVVVEGEIQSDAREARRRVDHSQNSNVCNVM
ncbi:hypothetical protein WR25_27305 [Diploscapter pachys]|uniref:Ras-related protein Rab-28 n=1 Tax=Diploscapter pachys TaxID=2018661 RepID=A0A2A2K626_9BILA|nr:hypothetical protein WR25_27305 [Diploscapter pachys]